MSINNIPLTRREDLISGIERIPDTPRSYEFTQSFMGDVADEFLLSTTLGLAISSGLNYNGFRAEPYDPAYETINPEEIEGYEGYEGFFANTRNQAHLNYKKSIIDTNERRRGKLASTDRIFLPALVAGFGDPINYIPIPLFKGMSFTQRFVKGGAFTGATVAAFEPARRNLDPTSNNLETFYHIAGGVALGGLFTGAFGRRISGPVRKSVKDKGGIRKIESNIYKSHSETEGKIDFESTPFNYKVRGVDTIDEFADGKVIVDLKQKELVKYVSTQTKFSEIYGYTKKGIPLKRSINYFDKNKHKIVINEAKLRKLYSDGVAGLHRNLKVVPIPISIFKSVDDYISFEIKTTLLKKYFKIKKFKDETTVEYENRIRSMALEELTKDATANLTSENNFLTRTIENFTPLGRVVNTKFTNKSTENYVKKAILKLSGDFGVVSRAAKENVVLPSSALLELKTGTNSILRNRLIETKLAFTEFKTGSSIPRNNPIDIDRQFIAVNTGTIMKNLVSRITGRNDDSLKNTSYAEFKHLIFKAQTDDIIFNDPTLHPVIKKQAQAERDFYKYWAKEIDENRLLLDEKNLLALIDNLKATKIRIRQEYNALRNKSKLQIERHTALIRSLDDSISEKQNAIKGLAADDNLSTSLAIGNNEYGMRLWRRDKLFKSPEEALELFEEWIASKPFYQKQTPEYNKKAARKAYDNIIDKDSLDPEGITGLGKRKNGSITVGGNALMSRSFDIPNKKVLDFIETDIDYIKRIYIQRVGTGVEIKKKFGDHLMERELIDVEHKMIMTELKTSKDVDKINSVLQTIEDERDKMFGSISLQDPTSLSRRTAAFLRDWASLAFMGKVVLSATVDAARPIMVHGFDKTYKDGLKQWATNTEGYAKASQNVKNYMGAATDLVLGNARRRVIEEGGFVGKGNGKLNAIFDRVADVFNNAQGPFYILNGLAPWTQMMKELTSVVSVHRTLEDSIKWSKGTLDKKGIDRLMSYGIDNKTANVIARMPIENYNGLLTGNTNMWGARTGGANASRALKNAVYADVERTIITPGIADRPTMMDGVISITDPKKVNAFDNKLFRGLGYQRTARGAKISNAYLGLPFQFMAWSFAANRKLLQSGLSDREQAFMSGLVAMVSLGMFADYMKNPRYWESKPIEEKILRAVEQSGALTIFTDLNLILETMSGSMGYPLGLRPAVGVNPLFGDPNVGDAIGGVAGAGPSIPIDLIHAFATDQTYDDRAATIRRIIPYNTLIWTNSLFKSIYNSGANVFKPEEM